MENQSKYVAVGIVTRQKINGKILQTEMTNINGLWYAKAKIVRE